MGAPRTYLVGAKNFSEQFILAELISERLAREGATAERKQGLGSAIAFRALASGDIDVYVDYSGTLWTNVMERRDSPERQAMLDELTRWMAERHNVRCLGALGFENAYALAMKRERAAALNVRTIDDLARHAPRLSFGTDLEFLSRPEWSALKRRIRAQLRGAALVQSDLHVSRPPGRRRRRDFRLFERRPNCRRRS